MAAALHLQAPLAVPPAGVDPQEAAPECVQHEGAPPSCTEPQAGAPPSRPRIDVDSLLSGTFSREGSSLASCEGLPMGSRSGATLSSADYALGGEGGRAAAAGGPHSFPLLAVVRLEHVKHALLLGAVDAGVPSWLHGAFSTRHKRLRPAPAPTAAAAPAPPAAPPQAWAAS